MTGGSTINPNLLPYLPSSYLNSQGDLTVSVAQATSVATDIETRADALPPAQKQLFLDLVSDDSSELAPSGGAPPADLDATLTRLQKASAAVAALTSFLSLGVDPADLAKAIILLADSADTQALNEQLSDINQAAADLLQQAGEDESSANALTSGALTSLILGCVAAAATIAGGLITLGGAGSSINKISTLMGDDDDDDGAVDGADDTDDVDDTSDPDGQEDTDPDDNDNAAGANKPPRQPIDPAELKKIEYEMNFVQAVSGILSGMSTALNAGSNYASTDSQAESKIDEAQGSIDAAKSQQVQAQATIAQTLQQTLTTFMTAMMQYVSQIESSVAEQMQAITKG